MITEADLDIKPRKQFFTGLKDNFEKYAYTMTAAKKLVKKISENKYNLDAIEITRISCHPDDWYLWAVIAPHADKPMVFDIWTLNLDLMSLNHGYYDTDFMNVSEVIKKKMY